MGDRTPVVTQPAKNAQRCSSAKGQTGEEGKDERRHRQVGRESVKSAELTGLGRKVIIAAIPPS